jgi:hypothetical protein
MAAITLAPVASEAAGQENKMATCSKETHEKGLGEGMGDERKGFMKK